MGVVDFDDPLSHQGSKARGLNPVDYHRHIRPLRRFDQDASLSVLNLVQLAFLVTPKRLLHEVPDCRKHTADQIRVG
jgi:hypothetical protein